MRTVLDKFIEGIKARIVYSVTFFFENRAVFEIMWKNTVNPDRPLITIWHIACWIPNAKNTHSEYVMLIVFTRQQWL